LDCYVWDKTCAFLAERIEKNGKCVPISVNVSRIDVYNSNLPQLLLSLVQKYNLNPQYLHLEITETAYMENQDQLILVINRLKELGFMIEMDDFGTGYSSLSMLSELPIDILKLDMSLIQRETEPNHNILSFIISLAKWMNLLVVAEGVETREQVNLLRNMDCDYVQGYYYARPLPSDDFSILLANAEISPMPHGMEEQTKTDGLVFRQSKGDLTILIIDDSGANRSALTEIFSDLYTVVEADNATVAYQYIKGHFDEIAVILLDLIMPGMDGFQLMEKLYAHELYCKIPIIITAQAEKMSEARALSLGAADFIAKPYHKELAIHRVRNVIAGEKLQLLTQEEELLHRMRQMEKAAKSDALT
ncbi:MAG: EAL domain-containing protein, partial [Oscillospiraceae bacterium]